MRPRIEVDVVKDRAMALFEASELSQAEVARRMGTSDSQVKYLLDGDRPWSEEWIVKFSKALNISPIELFREAEGAHKRLYAAVAKLLTKITEDKEIDSLAMVISRMAK